MAKHIQKGRLGEELALDYLIKSGYEILETNFRHGKAEIDIIFMDCDVLVFVEVKTRTSDVHGSPELAISAKKIKMTTSAAAAFMDKINYESKIRFDVITVVARSEEDFELEHFQDAYFY